MIEMIFYVYMSPDVIRDAEQGGPLAMQLLIGILLGFLQNCCITEFEDKRTQKFLWRNVDQLPPSDERKRIKLLLNALKKQGRFICCLIPDYGIENINIAKVNDQVEKALLDFLFIGKNEVSQISCKVEASSLDNYNQSNFASERSSLACVGKTLKSNELDQYEFLDRIFKKALLFTTRIEICDYIFGRKFGDNFEYTFSTLFKWLEENAVESVSLEKIVIHCEEPSSSEDDNRYRYKEHMKTQLARVKKGKFSTLKIEIRFYNREESGKKRQALPHDRYIITDQISLYIGRGMDFLNPRTKRNRDISINYVKKEEVASSLSGYQKWMLEPVIV